MRKYICSCLVLILLFSCSIEKKTYKDAEKFFYDDFGEEIALKADELLFTDEPLKPIALSVIDSVLFVKSVYSEYWYSLYSLNTHNKIGEMIKLGNGPGEMANPELVHFDEHQCMVYDSRQKKLYAYDKDAFLSGVNHCLKEVTFDSYFESIFLLDNNRIAATVLDPGHNRMSLYDNDGNFIETLNDFPSVTSELTFLEKIEGFGSNVAISPSNHRFFLCYKLTDLIEVYDTDLNLIKRSHGPDHFFPAMKQFNDGEFSRVRSIKGEVRDGYFSPVWIGDNCFMLYSGKYYTGEPNYLMEQIFVFDKDGKPVRRYTLDVPIFTMTADQESRTIYGITDEPEHRIVKYELLD